MNEGRNEHETIREAIRFNTEDDDTATERMENPKHIINKSEEDISKIRVALKNDIVMKKLSKAQVDALIDAFQIIQVDENTIIIDEGNR